MTATARHRLLISVGVLPFVLILLRTAWINDDAYITFRTIDNFIAGYGPVWNVGERVQAFTHPLWLLLLSGARFMSGEMYYTTLWLSVAISVAAVLLVALFVADTTSGAILAILIFTCAKSFVDFSTSGLENALTHLLLAAFLAVLVRRAAGRRWLFALALLAGLLTLNRADTLLLVLPALFYAWYGQRSLRSTLVVAAGFMPFVLWELFSLFYYGSLVPNTAYAKLNAGAPVALMVQQGLFYLLRSVDIDPLTVIVILCAVPAAFAVRDKRSIAVAVGILLYLAYIISIGGDFMASRFLTAPLVAAVAIVVRLPLPSLQQAGAYVLFALVFAVSLLNPATNPLLSSFDYKTTINTNQVEDMRGHHYARTGLLNATASNRLYDQGVLNGRGELHTWVSCEGMGAQEYYAGPQIWVIDRCALTDALLARLPAIYTPDIYVGHYYRKVPDGYLTTVQTGENHIVDSKLAEYYDKLSTVIAGPLFDLNRLQEIWKLNTGQYNHLIDADAYRYPDRVGLTLDQVDRAAQDRRLTEGPNIPPTFETNGARIALGAITHAPYVDLGLDGDYYAVTFLKDGTEVGRQTIAHPATPLGKDFFTIVDAPPSAQQSGYDALGLLPLKAGRSVLAYVEPIDPARWTQPVMDSAQLRQILHLFDHTYFRGDAATQQALLPLLRASAAQATAAAWEGIPLSVRTAMLMPRDRELQATIRQHLPVQTVLSNADGQARLRYLGSDVRQTPMDKPDGLQSDLFFEVIAPLDESYSLWFHIVDNATDDQWMIYDYFPATPTQHWQEATVYKFPVEIELEPASYDISFGFWTPNVRERLYVDQAKDIYWLNMGTHTVEPDP